MEVNIYKAVKVFFSNSSFEMIYNETLAKALDAEANEISIKISLPGKIFNLLHRRHKNGLKRLSNELW